MPDSGEKMPTATEDKLTLARQEVHRRFGQCLLRLQGYELLIKAIVATHEISAPIASLADALIDRATDARYKTLGTLMGEMIGSFIVASGTEGIGPSQDDAPSVAFRMQIVLSEEDFSRTQSDLRDLVKLRNDLVHHFLEQHQIRTQEGCIKAQVALSLALERITQADNDLRSWAEHMEQTRERMAEYFVSPEFTDFIVHGRVPWSITGIVQALKEADVELASDGWTSVDAAVQWVNEKYPDEEPDGYGCTSWRQVIHTSQLFELRYLQSDGPCRAWYRLRDRDLTPN
jgi:hypothetical protein